MRVIKMFTFLFLFSGLVVSQSNSLFWKGNAEDIVKFIKSKENPKIIFALQKIIEDPNQFKDNSVGYLVYKIFKSKKHDRIRQMALVALYEMKYYFLLCNLKEDLYKEKNVQIRKQIISILDRLPVLKNLN